MSSSTSTEDPPFICDNCSNAKSAEISSTIDSPRIISFKNLDFTTAALVVPGNTL